jgi:HK97 family phage major capsid protein/HK97 family phage prohead protease
MRQDAYMLLNVKAVDAATRTIHGIASTPDLDRQDHIIDPAGVTFTNPVPLLLHHDQTQPVGSVTLKKQNGDITFEATLPVLETPGRVKDRVDEAWQSVAAGLITGASIGWRVIGDAIEFLKNGTIKFSKTEILEVSLVTIPANQQATIRLVKAFDLAASGLHSPGITGPRMNGGRMTTAEQITQFENTRAVKQTRMTEIMAAAAKDAATLDGPQAEEYETLKTEVTNLNTHVARLKEFETLQAATATPITSTAGTSSTAAAVVRGGSVISVRATVDPGIRMARYAGALVTCRGNRLEAAEYARQRWESSTPEVALELKAAVAPGTTTGADWAGPLVNPIISADFLELLRPKTILGRIPGLRTVPFNVKVPSQTAGGTYGWVGETKPKPVTKLAFSSETLGVTKAAGIIVLTQELMRLSNPSAEQLCRDDMIAGIAQFLDQQFIDPAVAAVAGVNPASITNGAPTAAATTDPLADILALISSFAAAGIPTAGATIIMSEANALALSFQKNSDGSPAFPGVTVNGGSFMGINVVTSQAAGTNVIALQPSRILYADDGGVSIDMSAEASLQMDSAPVSPADATTVYVSLWQTNSVGLRAERFINWKRVHANAVMYLTGATYPARFTVGP